MKKGTTEEIKPISLDGIVKITFPLRKKNCIHAIPCSCRAALYLIIHNHVFVMQCTPCRFRIILKLFGRPGLCGKKGTLIGTQRNENVEVKMIFIQIIDTIWIPLDSGAK